MNSKKKEKAKQKPKQNLLQKNNLLKKNKLFIKIRNKGLNPLFQFDTLFMKITKSLFLIAMLFFCSCAKIVTDTEKTSKNSSASTRINNSQSSSSKVLDELN